MWCVVHVGRWEVRVATVGPLTAKYANVSLVGSNPTTPHLLRVNMTIAEQYKGLINNAVTNGADYDEVVKYITIIKAVFEEAVASCPPPGHLHPERSYD